MAASARMTGARMIAEAEMEAGRPVPVFVLGLQRSGTTWLANMLAGSGAVTAVQAEDHRGAHESIFFSHFAKGFGPWEDARARAAFAEAFRRSDYFLLTGLEPAALDAILARAGSHAEVFVAVMDETARREGRRLWLEKSPDHTLLGAEIAGAVPGARFLCVIRGGEGLVLSRLAAYGRTPVRGLRRLADILRAGVVNGLHRRHLEAFCRDNPAALLLRYEALVADPQGERARIIAFLGLDLPPERLESAYSANTSHDRGGATRRLSGLDRAVLATGETLGAAAPLSALRAVKEAIERRRGLRWPDWCWKRSGYAPG